MTLNLNVNGYYLIHPQDTEEQVHFTAAESEPSLETLQTAVRGYIEVVPYWPYKGSEAICNEEGKLQGLPVNHLANELWQAGRTNRVGDYLVGTVIVLCGKARLS